MLPKHGCNDLYYHPFNFPKGSKLFSYLTSLSRHGPIIHQPQLLATSILQKQLEIYLLFQFSRKNACNDLFHPYKLDER